MWSTILILLSVLARAHPFNDGDAKPGIYLSNQVSQTSYFNTPTSQTSTTDATPTNLNPELRLRDVAFFNKTCGYDPQLEAPITCAGNAGCYTWREANAQGCCDTRLPASACDIATSCVDSSAVRTLTGSKPPHVRWCTASTAPYCAEYIYPYGGLETSTQHFCDSAAITATLYPHLVSLPTSTSVSIVLLTASSTGPNLGGGNTSPTGGMPTDFNVGAAAGGAVRGSMIVGLLGWWAITKKKAKKRRNSARLASSQVEVIEAKIT